MPKEYNRKIDVIIPAYNVPDEILFRCLASIACQEIVKELEVTIVDDASTKQHYHEVAKNFKSFMKINILRYEVNGGPGVARQYGIDHTSNGYMTFIDADDTFNGSLALKILRNGIEANGDIYQMCVGIFDEVQENNFPEGEIGPGLLEHAEDMIWMFGKLYRRSFIDKYKIRFHETSRANEDNGFNMICHLCTNELEQINFISAHVYYWHENINSITRINNCQYSFGSSKNDSFYGYVENIIYAAKEGKKRNVFDSLTMWAVSHMLTIYEYYIECVARAPEHAEQNFEWCRWYYNEIYKEIEENVSDEILAFHYNETMKNAYINNKLNDIIPCMNIFEFLNKLKTS